MMKISIAFLAATSLAGFACRKAETGDAMARLGSIKDRMCACSDKACSEKVSEELVLWSEQQEKSAGDRSADKATEKQVKAEIAQCLLKLEVPRGDGAGSSGGSAAAGGGADGAAGGAEGAAGPADGAAAPAQGSAAAHAEH